ncbi:MAG: hypothetical protein HZB80_05585 [Deltaproteobacteria bacterium]|nr:hypothetical protein [Deltaproteobacteria bacterium]
MEFQEYIERLKTVFICEKYDAEIKKAKQEFIAHGGELGSEIDGYEEALDIFFDWYLFERPQLREGFTPLILLYRSNIISEEARKVYLDFTKYIHSIFIIKKNVSYIKVMDIFTKNKYLVTEAPSAIMERGDMVEARLLLFRGEYRFSGAFCFYPDSIYSIIKTEAAEASKAGAENFVPLIRKFRRLKTVWSRCSKMDINKIHTLMEEGRLA